MSKKDGVQTNLRAHLKKTQTTQNKNLLSFTSTHQLTMLKVKNPNCSWADVPNNLSIGITYGILCRLLITRILLCNHPDLVNACEKNHFQSVSLLSLKGKGGKNKDTVCKNTMTSGVLSILNIQLLCSDCHGSIQEGQIIQGIVTIIHRLQGIQSFSGQEF